MTQDPFNPEDRINVCPLDCPNRKRAAEYERGKAGGYLFSIFCLLIALLSTLEVKNGGWQPRENVNIVALVVLLPMAGLGLGVQVDADAVGKLFGITISRE